MAWAPLAVAVVGTVLSAAGNAKAADAARAAAAAQQTEKDFEAAQLSQQAGQVEAAAGRTAEEQLRQSRLVASRILALSAAGGGGATDPTVAALMQRTAGVGAYNASVALYEGEEKARLLRLQASGAAYSGEIASIGGQNTAKAYELKGLGSSLSSLSLFTKYGAGGPSNIASGATLSSGSWLDTGTEAIAAA